MMPLSGVRSSCETLARKRLLASVAARGLHQRAGQQLVLVAQLEGVLRNFARGHGGEIALGDVHQGADHAGDLAALVADEALAGLDNEARTVLEQVIALERPGLGAGGDALQQPRAKTLLLVGRDEVPGAAAHDAVRRAAQQAAHRLIAPCDHALAVGLLESHGRAIE